MEIICVKEFHTPNLSGYITDENIENVFLIDIEKNAERQELISGKVEMVPLIPYDNKKRSIGKEFHTSYEVMSTIKKIIDNKERCIGLIVFACRYVNTYFTLQTLLYSGLNKYTIKYSLENCKYTIMDSACYRFPDYWIRALEKQCYEKTKSLAIKRPNIQSQPLLSIIIPFYNLGEYLLETIGSVEKGTYTNYELIIVNDGSNDESSIAVLKKISNPHIHIINKNNEGLSSARNAGASVAKGQYITFLDADDLVKQDYYQRAVHVLEAYEDVSLVYSWVEYFEGNENIWINYNLCFPYLLMSNMSAAFYVIRKECFLQYGLNDMNMRNGMEDYDSLIRMTYNGCKGVAIPDALVLYRDRADSMSKKFSNGMVIKVYNDILDKNVDIYNEYAVELMKLMISNGPGYLCSNPTIHYDNLTYDVNKDDDEIKFMLKKILNSWFGKFFVRLLLAIKRTIK